MVNKSGESVALSVTNFGQEKMHRDGQDSEGNVKSNKNAKGASKDNKISKKWKIPQKLIVLLAEFLGTGLLMFIGCMGCMTQVSAIPLSHLGPGFTFGLTVLLVMQMIGHISGAHLNPSVTLASYIVGNTKLDMVLPYLAGEFLGAIAGFGLLLIATPSEYTETTAETVGICTTVPHSLLTVPQSILIEAVVTGMLVFACCAAWDKRNWHNTDSNPVKFGLIVAVLSMTAGPFTYASMNPARSFAPALLNNKWELHWVYWVGPIVGAIVTALLYKFVFLEDDEDKKEDLGMQQQQQENSFQECPNNVRTSTCNTCKPDVMSPNFSTK